MNLVAFDLATDTGWASYCSADSNLHSETEETLSGTKSFKAGRREVEAARWYNAERFMTPLVIESDVVGYERIDFAHKSIMAARCYFSLEAVLSLVCLKYKKPLLGFAPSEIKRLAVNCGGGPRAGKDAMVAAAKEQWPDQGIEAIKDNNQADALWVLACLMRNQGIPFNHYAELAV